MSLWNPAAVGRRKSCYSSIAAAAMLLAPSLVLAAESSSKGGGGTAGGPLGLPLNPLWLVLFLVSVGAWLYTVQWIYDDAQGVDAEARFWATISAAAGLVGVVLTVLIHAAVSGATLVCVGCVFALYVRSRNEKVPVKHRLFGDEHMREIKDTLYFWRSGGGEEVDLEGIPLTREDGKSLQHFVTWEPEMGDAAAALNRWLTDAVRHDAAELDILPTGEGMTGRLLLDGVPQTLETTDAELGKDLLRVVNWLTSQEEEEKERTGRHFYAQLPGDDSVKIDVRPIKTKGGGRGARMTLPSGDEDLHENTLDVLGMEEEMVEKVQGLLDRRKGALLVTGPEDSGVTTTLHALMQHVDLFVASVVALEDQPQRELMQINQMEIDPSGGDDFETVFKRALRDEPDMVMVDTLENAERLDALFTFAADDGMLLGPLRVARAPKAVIRLLQQGLSPKLLHRSLTGVLNQRLVRKLCPDCKEEYEPSKKLRKRLNLPIEKPVSLYRAAGCGQCLETGYSGRTAIFELLLFAGDVKALVKKAAAGEAKLSSKALKKAAGGALLSLEKHGMQKVKEGVTSLQEVRRVLGGSRSRSGAGKKNT